MQWAHLASGGAGGGMRWPNRSPHTLTDGMRKAQLAMSRFLPNIDWRRFHRRNISDKIEVRVGGRPVTRKVARFGCASSDQALLYLLRRDSLAPDGTLDPESPALEISIALPELPAGKVRLVVWDTVLGQTISDSTQQLGRDGVLALPMLAGDYAVAIRVLA